ncbi:hypothetical protein M5K25_028095 [Dendrobium thyrsiflorum]|uniref:Uncharacterized protein n=1 Tax=Dendrobium thyrsiflorum TaxID=117978 RepID=A0ABD0TVI4_DENTH
MTLRELFVFMSFDPSHYEKLPTDAVQWPVSLALIDLFQLQRKRGKMFTTKDIGTVPHASVVENIMHATCQISICTPMRKTYSAETLVPCLPSIDFFRFGYYSNDYNPRFLLSLGGITRCGLRASPPNPTILEELLLDPRLITIDDVSFITEGIHELWIPTGTSIIVQKVKPEVKGTISAMSTNLEKKVNNSNNFLRLATPTAALTPFQYTLQHLLPSLRNHLFPESFQQHAAAPTGNTSVSQLLSHCFVVELQKTESNDGFGGRNRETFKEVEEAIKKKSFVDVWKFQKTGGQAEYQLNDNVINLLNLGYT